MIGTPRVALVTEGSGDVGRSISLRLAADGQVVVMLFSGERARVDETVARIIAAGGTAIAVKGDIADENDMAAVFDRVEQEFGGVDVVVNTAGILLLGPMASFDLADLDRMYRVNIRGNYVISQLASTRVRSGGAIINFSTSLAELQQPGCGAFAASNGAVNAMTLVLASELRGRDITVNAVVPVPTSERPGVPADVAKAVSFLAGPARWVNGQFVYAMKESFSGSRSHATIAQR